MTCDSGFANWTFYVAADPPSWWLLEFSSDLGATWTSDGFNPYGDSYEDNFSPGVSVRGIGADEVGNPVGTPSNVIIVTG